MMDFLLRTTCFRLFRPTTSTWYRLARSTTWLSTCGTGVAASKWPPTRCRPRWRPSRLQRTAPTSWRWVTGTSNFGTWNILDRPRFVASFNRPTFRLTFIFTCFTSCFISVSIDWCQWSRHFSSFFVVFFLFFYCPSSGRGRFVFLSVIQTRIRRACLRACLRAYVLAALRSIRNLCRWWAVRPYWVSSATTTFVTSDAVAVRWVTPRTPLPRRVSSVNSTTVAFWTNGSN